VRETLQVIKADEANVEAYAVRGEAKIGSAEAVTGPASGFNTLSGLRRTR
jgi:hypothetical protein